MRAWASETYVAALLVGRLTHARPQGDYRVLRFRALEALRGLLGTTVEARTGAGGGRCGIELTPCEDVGVVVYAVPLGLVPSGAASWIASGFARSSSLATCASAMSS